MQKKHKGSMFGKPVLYETENIVQGHCPDCGEDYGVVKELHSGKIVSEYVHCFCKDEGNKSDWKLFAPQYNGAVISGRK